jgi:hypothetical protein
MYEDLSQMTLTPQLSVMPCSYCHFHAGFFHAVFVDLEDGDDVLLRNGGRFSKNDTTSYLLMLEFFHLQILTGRPQTYVTLLRLP